MCSAADDPTTYDTERVVRDMRYHPSLSGKSEDYIAGWDAAAVLLAEAAAGPRDGCAYQCPHDKATHERYPNDIDHDYVEAAAGPRDLFAASDLDDPESPFYDDSPWVPALPCSYKPPHRTSCDKPEDDPVHAKLDKRRLPGQHVYRAPRTGPRERLVLPPPDPSLIDTLGEGTDPDRPVRVLADDYPTIEPRRYGKMG